MTSEPIRSGASGFVGISSNVGVCLLFNFLYYPEGKAFESRPHIKELHEYLGIHRLVSDHYRPEVAISRFVADFFPTLSLKLYVNIKDIEQADIGSNVKAHYRSLDCPLMFFAKNLSSASPSQYHALRNRKNHIWRVAESALEENLKACSTETVEKETRQIRITSVSFDNDIALPSSFFPKPR